MSDAYQDRPRRPLRETVCEIDRDILRLVMRRHNIIARMSAAKGHLVPQEEKFLRESWEHQVSRISNDPRLSTLFFKLMQEVEFLPRPEDGVETKRTAFGLAPAKQPVKINLEAPVACRVTRAWMSLAAGSGSVCRLTPSLMNDPIVDCLKMFNQMGAALTRDAGGITAAKTAPAQTPDKVIYAGESSFNFYLALGHYLGHPSRAKFTGGSQLEFENLAGVRQFVPALGARIVPIIPKNEGLPVRVECSGMLPDTIVFPSDVPSEFVEGMLLAAPFYEKTVEFDLSACLQKERIANRVIPLLKAANAEIEQDGEKIHITPSKLTLPEQPTIAMEAELAQFFLVFPAVLSGKTTLRGTWSVTPEADAVLEIFRQSGQMPTITNDAVTLESDGKLTVPDKGFEIPAALPSEWQALPVALTCIAALKTGSAQFPTSYVAGDKAWTVAESFARACGLAVSDEGMLSRTSAGSDEENPYPVWTAPTAPWACAFAATACARPEAPKGFRLNNPGIMTELFPGFWAIYNALPEPEVIEEKKTEQPKRRRIITEAVARLTPRDEDDEY